MVRLARRIFERFCASAISRAASSSSRSSVFIGASFGARFIVDSSGAFGAGFTAALGVRTGSGSFFASSDFVVFDAHDGGARGVERGVGGADTVNPASERGVGGADHVLADDARDAAVGLLATAGTRDFRVDFGAGAASALTSATAAAAAVGGGAAGGGGGGGGGDADASAHALGAAGCGTTGGVTTTAAATTAFRGDADLRGWLLSPFACFAARARRGRRGEDG